MHMSTKPNRAIKRKTLINLGKNDCRWPIGEPRHPDFHFCGAPQLPGRPYCELHWHMAFQPPRPRHQPAAPNPPAAAKAA
jgi:GcrA cell cycle regulator